MSGFRFWTAAAAAVFLSCALLARIARREPRRTLLRGANLVTLSRGISAALLAGAAAAPRRHRLGPWLWLLWGSTLSDWLDGPLARRGGATRLGARLDAHADAWLTLWAATAAWRSGLPRRNVAPALARYLFSDLGFEDLGAERPRDAAWQRAAGAAQMAAFAGVLSPWRRLRLLAARIAPGAALLQMAALAHTARVMSRTD